MNSMLGKRLARLEDVHTAATPSRERRRFYVEGFGDSDPAEFLRGCGHDVQPGDIIRQIISPAPQGGALFAALVNTTAEMRAKTAKG